MFAVWKNKVHLLTKKRSKIVTVILVSLAVNFVIFSIAFPQAFMLPKDATYARDFSAYYIGEWRLFHNPSMVYSGINQPGDYSIAPSAQAFKYTPNFLLLFAPFITLNYESALAVFDLMELALIPLLAFFVYKLVKDKNLVVGAIVSVIVLIDPLPSLQINNTVAYFASYFFGYQMGNAHVLQTVLLVGALYFGFSKKPWLSALLFSFGFLDPRPALLAAPLLLYYNRQKLVQFIGGLAGFISVTILPFFFYQNIGNSFIHEEMQASIVSQWYPYDWIPIFSVVALTVMEIINYLQKKQSFGFLKKRLNLKPFA
jgi:hypothetical protein